MLASLALAGTVLAQNCPPGAMGTSRTIAVDPSVHRRIGLLQYRETLPLEDHEVVLTFDDGPLPPYTPKVLDALAAECVKATFFIVGQQAEAYPDLLRREYREGHTIGTHTEHHRYLNRLSADAAKKEITDGIASVGKILGSPNAAAPFFRFPYLDQTAASEAIALKLGLAIWSTDFHGSDWERLTPEQVAAIAITRLERNKKGILMLHDIHERTALALPIILSGMKKRGYHVVQAVPAVGAPSKSAAKPGLWMTTTQR
ncbi:MAG: polysaccharide deacetylase family protein [Rhodomicrobium sp.]